MTGALSELRQSTATVAGHSESATHSRQYAITRSESSRDTISGLSRQGFTGSLAAHILSTMKMYLGRDCLPRDCWSRPNHERALLSVSHIERDDGSLQLLLEGEALLLDCEADSLVEPDRPGRIVVVYAQHSPGHALRLQGTKGMQHQPGSDAGSSAQL